MSADPAATPATGSVSVRLPVALISHLDQLCALTDRTRTYWVQIALEAIIAEELDIATDIATDHDSPDDVSGEHMEEWLIENGLSTREALDRGRIRHGQPPVGPAQPHA